MSCSNYVYYSLYIFLNSSNKCNTASQFSSEAYMQLVNKQKTNVKP